MRRPASLILLLNLLMVCGGCVTVEVGSGAGAGVGVYSYLNGDLKAVYAVPIQTIWPQVLTAMETLQLTIDHRSVDGLGGLINLRRVDGTPITVRLAPTPEDSTLIRVRVGALGNKEESLRIHQIIQQIIQRELGA